jgi:hypothetical protein
MEKKEDDLGVVKMDRIQVLQEARLFVRQLRKFEFEQRTDED